MNPTFTYKLLLGSLGTGLTQQVSSKNVKPEISRAFRVGNPIEIKDP